jgi:serine/threonine protein phosphatase PrpC
LSRAIGDFEFKKSADLSPEQQIVTAFPDVIAHEISDDDEFLVIACDGRFDRKPSFNSTADQSQVFGIANRRKLLLSSCEEALLRSRSYIASART